MFGRTRTMVIVIAVLAAACARNPLGPGSPAPGGPATGTPIFPAPGQPAAGPPSWLAPGARLTWYVAAASVAQSRFAWVEDPAGPWEDPKTGKRYRRTDEGGGEGQPGASGDGYSQVDVLAFDGTRVALGMDLFGIDHVNNLFIWTPLGGSPVDAKSVDGAWFEPAQLGQLARDGVAGMLVLRGPYRLGDMTHDAVSFVSGLGTANYFSYTYDLATGILLSANTSTGGVTSPIRAQGENPPVGNTQLTMARFAGLRTRSLPGAGDPSPEWVARTAELAYGGIYNWTNPIDPSSGNLNFDVQHTVQLRPGGTNWSAYTARTLVPGLATDSELQGVSGATGIYWYSPAALAQMSQGQLLDRDPVTGEQTTVAALGQATGGAALVTLETAMPGIVNRLTYDRASGMLVAYESRQVGTGITISIQLTGSR